MRLEAEVAKLRHLVMDHRGAIATLLDLVEDIDDNQRGQGVRQAKDLHGELARLRKDMDEADTLLDQKCGIAGEYAKDVSEWYGMIIWAINERLFPCLNDVYGEIKRLFPQGFETLPPHKLPSLPRKR